jgi:hypothetical protein
VKGTLIVDQTSTPKQVKRQTIAMVLHLSFNKNSSKIFAIITPKVAGLVEGLASHLVLYPAYKELHHPGIDNDDFCVLI